MSPWTRHLMSLSLLLAVLSGAHTQGLESLRAAWAALSDASRALAGERLREQRLNAQDGAPQQRLAIKTAAAHRLIAGELTLPEAAAWFRHANEQVGPGRDYFRDYHPSLGAEEAACRQVIEWVRGELNQTAPGRTAEVVRRLEAELRGLRECEGQVVLPEL
jgi:hypothetical protein